MVDAEKFNFMVEHCEEQSQMTKEYLLTVYVKRTGPTELSLFDIKNKRVFLKRGVYEQDGVVRLEDLYVDGTVTVCARKLKITGYADSVTRQVFEKSCEQVYSVIGSAAYSSIGDIMSAAAENGFTIKRVKTLMDVKGSRRSVAMELVGHEAIQRWQEVLEQLLGSSGTAAVTVGPCGPLADKVFDSRETTATCEHCSLCIVRPHALREGQAGAVVSAILEAGLDISAMQTFGLLKSQAENFYEVYKTVVPSAQYTAMISELASGTCLVLEVRAAEDVVPRLRELCGPFDVEIARHLRPGTIRARLGRDNVHNVVHCTDLPEDGVLECQYFFTILPGTA